MQDKGKFKTNSPDLKESFTRMGTWYLNERMREQIIILGRLPRKVSCRRIEPEGGLFMKLLPIQVIQGREKFFSNIVCLSVSVRKNQTDGGRHEKQERIFLSNLKSRPCGKGSRVYLWLIFRPLRLSCPLSLLYTRFQNIV